MYKSIIKPGFFCYAIAHQTLATTVQATPAINISNDSDFMLCELRAIVESAGIPDTSVTMTLSLSSGDLFSNVALDLLSFASIIIDVATQANQSGYPIRLNEPVRIPANSQINCQVQNNTADTLRVQVQLWGYKVDKKQED
jgi:hypothetical protein